MRRMLNELDRLPARRLHPLVRRRLQTEFANRLGRIGADSGCPSGAPAPRRGIALHAACGDQRTRVSTTPPIRRAASVVRYHVWARGRPTGSPSRRRMRPRRLANSVCQTSSYQGMEPPRREAVQLVQHSAHRAQEPQ